MSYKRLTKTLEGVGFVLEAHMATVTSGKFDKPQEPRLIELTVERSYPECPEFWDDEDEEMSYPTKKPTTGSRAGAILVLLVILGFVVWIWYGMPGLMHN